jgi:hypothetical protein
MKREMRKNYFKLLLPKILEILPTEKQLDKKEK